MSRSKQPSRSRNGATRLGRSLLAAFGFLAIVMVIWSFSDHASNPVWFNAVVTGLSAINLLAWVLQRRAQDRLLPCKSCGRMRPYRARKCIFCGAKGFKVPLVNWIALALISALFASGGIALIWACAVDNEAHEVPRLLIMAVTLILLSVMVVATACDGKFPETIRAVLGGLLPYDIDEDIDWLRKHRPTAARAIPK